MIFYIRATLCALILFAVPLKASALAKRAHIVTCHPSQSGGEVHIEGMIYDHAGVSGRKFDNVPQYGSKNFFDVHPVLQRKLSDELVAGEIMHLTSAIRSRFLEEASILYAYTDKGPPRGTDVNFTNKARMKSETWSGKYPGSVTLHANHNVITCEFVSHKNIYTKMSVEIQSDFYPRYAPKTYRKGSEGAKICSGSGHSASYRVKWFTEKNEVPIKTENILAYCQPHSGVPHDVTTKAYEIELLKIYAIGTVRADLSRTKTLHEYDKSLYNRQYKYRP